MAARELTQEQKKKLLFGVLGVIGLVAWINVLLLPARRSLTEIRPQVENLRIQLAQTREGLANLSDMEEELSRLAAEYAVPTAPAPPEDQVPDLLKVVAQMARGAQVHLLEVTPRAALGAITPGPSGYLELPIEVQATAGYHQMGQFLDALEGSSHLVRVQAIEIQPAEEDIWRHRTVILLVAYLIPGPPKGE